MTGLSTFNDRCVGDQSGVHPFQGTAVSPGPTSTHRALFALRLVQMKVGSSLADDIRRAKLIRAIIDDPGSFPPGYVQPDPASLVGKNAGPTGCVLMMDANQVGGTEAPLALMSRLTTTPGDSVLSLFFASLLGAFGALLRF